MKKLLAGIVSLSMIFAVLCVPAFASDESEPYTNVYSCPSCERGDMSRHTSRTYDHTDDQPCSHGKKGVDAYPVYKILEEDICDSCGYTEIASVNYEYGTTTCHGY